MKLIRDVLFVPNIDQNLLSVGQLVEKGYIVKFEGRECLIKDTDSNEVLRVQMRDKSFVFKPNEMQQMALKCTEENIELWHKRLGHVHRRSMLVMQRNGLVDDLPSLKEELPQCRTCLLGKQTRFPFKGGVSNTYQKLELVHTDVCGPMSEPSLNGSRYFITFTDDLTRMSWIYFLQAKTEVADVFMKFKALVENQSGKRIKALRSDNGSEYTANKFKLICEQAGIVQQFSAPYSPQQNGVSERKNRSIMEIARCLMQEKNLPKSFWAEAANTAVFLLNRLPTKALEKLTPLEGWQDTKSSVKNLKVFGSLYYTHIPDVKRDKLD